MKTESDLRALARKVDDALGGEYAHWHIDEDGLAYIILTGTGDAIGVDDRRGAWAYEADDIADWLEQDHGEDSSYQHLCDTLEPVMWDHLARELWDDGLALNRPGACESLLVAGDEDDDEPVSRYMPLRRD